MRDVGGEDVEEILEVISEDSGGAFLSVSFLGETIVEGSRVPLDIEEDPIAVVTFHILSEVYLPLLHGLLRFL